MYINSFLLKKVSTSVAVGIFATAASYSSLTLAQIVSGKVIDNKGKAVNSALVSINGIDQTITTNEQGLFTFSNLHSGSFDLHASAKNYTHQLQHIEVGSEDISGIVLQLTPSVMEVFDVYATPLHKSTIESALPANVISGDDLKLKQASTLGETLKNEVGVHSSFYGSVTSSPIIRGLDGPRVLITQNGLDAGDASRIGADHAVTAETSTATQIEVLRGPATLFYGSGAIGGVVNVVDDRVPTSSDTMGEWLLQHNDVSDENQASFSLQTGHENFAIHLDGFWRDAGNYRLPNDFDSHAHEEEYGEDEDHEEELEENPSHLENSSSKLSGFTIGSSYLFDQGFVGFSFGKMNRDYGIPGHAHHEEEHEEESEHEEHEEGTSAEMEQDRFQILSEINFRDSFIRQFSGKFAYTDYQHQEVEEGLVGTTFTNESFELKGDLYHQNYNGWQGAWTVHYKSSEFEAIGEEAFTPPSTTDSFSLAWLEEKHFDNIMLQLGARIEKVTIKPKYIEMDLSIFEHEHEEEHENESVILSQQKYTPISASVGVVWDYQSGYNLGLSLGFSQRAPSAAELFSFGPHIGTSTYEVGALYDIEQEGDEVHVELSSQSPNIETSHSIDLTWRKFEGDFGFVISAFYNHINDYYYQQDTGLTFESEHDDHALDASEEDHEEESEALPILVYKQDNVDMYGVEADFFYQVSEPFKVNVFGDFIKAKLTDGGYLPRIPPMRIGAALQYQEKNYSGELSINNYFEQNDVSSLETVTDSYYLIDLNMNYYLDTFNNDLVVYAKANNLTDEIAKVHSSFLKDISPLPGRNFSIGIRGSF